MKVKLLVGRVSADVSNAPGDTIDVCDREAYALILSGQAEPKVKKDFLDLESRVHAQKEAEQTKQAKLIAVQKEQELKDEAESLLDQLLAIVAALDSAIQGYKQDFIEEFHAKFVNEKNNK